MGIDDNIYSHVSVSSLFHMRLVAALAVVLAFHIIYDMYFSSHGPSPPTLVLQSLSTSRGRLELLIFCFSLVASLWVFIYVLVILDIGVFTWCHRDLGRRLT